MRDPMLLPFALAGLFLVSPLLAQEVPATDTEPDAAQDARPERTLVVRPLEFELAVNDRAIVEAFVAGPDGQPTDEEVFFFSRSRRGVSVDGDGEVKALAPGDHRLIVRTRRKEGNRLEAQVLVHVPMPRLAEIRLDGDLPALFTGDRIALEIQAVDVLEGLRESPSFEVASSDVAVATITPWGEVQARAAGDTVLTIALEDQRLELPVRVAPNPAARLDFGSLPDTARTGDVLRFEATARDIDGKPLPSAKIQYSLSSRPDDDLGAAAGAQVALDGRFVAEAAGLHTVTATCGSAVAQHTLRVAPRDVGGKFELVGRGPVLDSHTSDLWVWTGVNGEDWAVTGTWGANGEAHFWNVTDPAAPERVATVTVDARTVNDVKVSPDGRLCVLSREGASDRKNGVVLVDVSNPREPRVISEYNEGLTGGVHNVFADGRHVYALSGGRRFDILDVSDPISPQTVGGFELETPGHSIHDVWVVDGVAYSSNWSDGVQMIDVGGGNMGGSPQAPVVMGSYTYPSGWNHAAYPYEDPETGRFYIIAGDEAFPYGLNITGRPTYPRGWIHFIDFTDKANPVEVARYQVPEAGTHNFWVQDDILYVAYYNGGVRAVDISGELMGDLYRQGREIAWYLPTDPEGFVPNAPMVWGPQPHKGNLFLSDWNSGLWVLKLIQGEG